MEERRQRTIWIERSPGKTNKEFQAGAGSRTASTFRVPCLKLYAKFTLTPISRTNSWRAGRAKPEYAPRIMSDSAKVMCRLRKSAGPGLAVGIGGALLQRRRVAHGLRVFHYGLERGLECFHLALRANSDAGVGWPDGPDASDEHIAGGHGVDHFFCGAPGVEHETVGLGGDVGIALTVEPFESFLADGGVQLFRSEEHTSELQSLTNLVCRLLLEKKKKTKKQ